MVKKTIADVFVEGARKGWTLGSMNILPNVLMAYALIQILKVTGLLTLLGKAFGPVMAIFGLPGEAIAVLLGAWLSMGGGVGVAATLYGGQVLNMTHISILIPAIFLMGSQVQYMGRLLGTAGVQTRFYPALFAICILNSCIAMFIMRFVA
jgi:spore maturation protein SpmB